MRNEGLRPVAVDVIKDFFLEANPNPERKGCPAEETLKALAENRLPLDHPARLHLASCSECFAEYTGYQGELDDRQTLKTPARVTELHPRSTRSRVLPWLVAASLLIVGVGGYSIFHHQPHEGGPVVQVASSDPVNATVDLFNAGTLRGSDDDPAPLQEVSLPAAMVHLSVTLPRFSQTGRYEVLVSKDKAGLQVVAMGAGLGVEDAERVQVDVTLDLRAAKAGAYFLATVRGADNGTYYYPLKVK